MTNQGKNNPNYKHGKSCTPTQCKCGNNKDYRAKQCAKCAKTGYKKGTKGIPIKTREQIEEAIKNTTTYLETAQYLNINRKTAKKLAEYYKCNIDHFIRTNDRKHNKYSVFKITKNRYDGKLLKRILLEECNKKNECEICGLKPIWQEKPLTLHVHHKNGNNKDNREHNLQLLCPNCHTQTFNYTGRNSIKHKANMKNKKQETQKKVKGVK